MKCLLLSLIGVLVLPNAVDAERANFYLLGRTKNNSYVVPMQTLESCEEAGKKFIQKESWSQIGKPDPSALLTYLCVDTRK